MPGLEDKYSGGPQGFGLRYDGPGTNLSGNPNLGGYPEFPAVDGKCVLPGFQCWSRAVPSPPASPGVTSSPAASSTTT